MIVPPAAGVEPNFAMYGGSAVFLIIVSWIAMRWAGKTVRKDLDPANTGKMRASMAIQADAVPPHLVKEALQKGLVTPQQMATMSPVERQFLFNQLKPRLDGSVAPAPLSTAGPPLPLKPTTPAAPVNAPQLRTTQAIPTIPGKPANLPPLTPAQIAALGPPPAQRPAPAPARPLVAAPQSAAAIDPLDSQAEKITVHCPCCGTVLLMPAFPPFVAYCDQCGAKTAVRREEQGRLVINTAPPGVTRRPVG